MGRTDLLRIAVSARSRAELPYAQLLAEAGPSVLLVGLTREAAGARVAGRLTAAEYASFVVPGATYYVCGSAGFAESASTALVAHGVPAPKVRVERFGPSG